MIRAVRRQTGSRTGARSVGVVFAFGVGLAVAVLLFGAGTASALAPGDVAEITGSYVTHAATSSSDPDFAACTALPQPVEPFWAFVDGNEHISSDVSGTCSSTSSPDPNQPGVTDYQLTYTYGASWGIYVNAEDVGTTMTLTMSFHTMSNVVATETYEITAATTATDTTTAAGTTSTAATTTVGTTTVSPAPTTTTPASPPPATTTPTQSPPPATSVPPPPTTTAETVATAGTTTTATVVAPTPEPAVITTAATIRAIRTGKMVSVTIRTNSKHQSLLCYHPISGAKLTCKTGHGTWTVHLRAALHSTIRRLFVVKVASKVVARKTITIHVA
jgi:hypothetical protein